MTASSQPTTRHTAPSARRWSGWSAWQHPSTRSRREMRRGAARMVEVDLAGRARRGRTGGPGHRARRYRARRGPAHAAPRSSRPGRARAGPWQSAPECAAIYARRRPCHGPRRAARRRRPGRVINTGPGIPAEDVPHVFERFYRVEKSRDQAHGGAGIGLAIVRQLVESVGGRVGVESDGGRPGSGSASRPERRHRPVTG